MGSSPAGQRGVALIVVLLILALMVSIAATMSDRLFSQFHRAGNQINYQQAYWYSLGVEALALKGSKQSLKDSDTVNLSQPWAIEEQIYPLDYGTAKGHVVDKQACFNINALANVTRSADSTAKPYLIRVWQQLLESLNVENYQAEVIAESMKEFVDQDSVVDSSYGVEDSYYESLHPAYMAADTLMADSSELRAVQQVSGEIMQKVQPFICAIPADDWRLNVNTIRPEQAKLLAAMFSPYLSEADARTVIESRPFDGWGSVSDFLAVGEISAIDKAAINEAKAYLSVDSHYFELDAQVFVDESRVRIRSLFYSENEKDATVIRRRFGGISERVPDRSAE